MVRLVMATDVSSSLIRYDYSPKNTAREKTNTSEDYDMRVGTSHFIIKNLLIAKVSRSQET